MHIVRIAAAIMLAAVSSCLCGCAAKQVTPVAMSQAGDESLTCAEIAQELKINEADAEVLVRKDKRVMQGNVAKNVGAAAIPYVGLLLAASTDLSNAEQIQARALIDRNEQLNYLAKQKGCNQ